MRTPLAIGAFALVFACVATTPAGAEPLRCQRAIAKASAQYGQARAQALRKCEEAAVGGSGLACPDATASASLATASAKIAAAIGKACGGDDRVCGGDLTQEDEPATIGWPARCPNFERGDCDGDVTDCGGIASCLTCLQDAAVDQALDLYYDDLLLPSSGALNRCQAAIGNATTAFLKAKSKALQKCWDGVMNGKFTGPCIAPAPGNGKYLAAIAKAETKKRSLICGACGGPDGFCDGVDDIAPSAIGFAADCPAVTFPGGSACGGAITTLDSLVTCVDCVTEFKVDCVDRAQVPQLAAYPSECNVCTAPPASGPCPTSMELTVDGARSDVDLGSIGLAHDVKAPDGARLTFAVSGCAGASQPSCGACAADGPIANAGGAAFDNQRCQDQPWIACGSDGDCTTAGAAGPCLYFFGPPQPFSGGGIPNCLMNRIAGPIAGTVNVDTGSTTLPTTLESEVYVLAPVAQPCPICDRICLGGSDDGTTCGSDADCDSNDCSATTICSAGPRVNQACVTQGTTPFGAVSLDCPPSPSGLAHTRTLAMQLATGVQSRTLTAASPPCRQTGYTSLTCFCDTCNNANAEVCATNADCPLSGGNPGICGGRRCIGGANEGAPCSVSSQCLGGGQCNRPGEPSQPNACLDSTAAPESGCVDVGNDQGECAYGPFDGVCSANPLLYCSGDADCNPPPTGTCPACATGQTCVSRARPCFTDNGLVGSAVTVTGSTEVPCDSVAKPTLGALFCVPPSGTVWLNVQGFPGLGRMTLPSEVKFSP